MNVRIESDASYSEQSALPARLQDSPNVSRLESVGCAKPGKGLKVYRNETPAIWPWPPDEIIAQALMLLGALKPGEAPTDSDHGACLWHLESLLYENREMPLYSRSRAAYALAERVAPIFALPVPWLNSGFGITPKWTGDEVAFVERARVLIQSSESILRRLDVQRYADLFDFYHGEQWDDHVKTERHEHSRPALVINRLPALVAAAIEKERATGSPDLERYEKCALIAAVTLRNQDAQRLYNYMASAAAEEVALPRQPLRFHRHAFALVSDPA